MTAQAPASPDAPPRVLVVGAGVIGVCCAYFLVRRGAQVTVVERAQIGAGASSGNAGTIAPGHPPVNKPGRVRKALTSFLDPLSPLYVAPRWDPTLARWLATFAANCTRRRLEESLRVMAPLGHATRRLFDEVVAEEGLDCGYRREGYYEVYRTPQGFAAAAEEARLVGSHGFQARIVLPQAMREKEPALRTGLVGSIHYADGATCDPNRFLLELADRARRHGAAFRTETNVTGVLMNGGKVVGARLETGETIPATAVVVCTGAYSLDLLGHLGVHLPIQAGKGYHRDRSVESGGTPALSITCMLGETSVFCTPLNGTVRYAGTMEFSGVNHQLRPGRLAQLTAAADRYLKGVGDVASTSEWCGLRPCAPDGLPVIGPVPDLPGLFVATGHAMLGLTLGPVTGKLTAECVIDGRPSIDITALSPGRFVRR